MLTLRFVLSSLGVCNFVLLSACGGSSSSGTPTYATFQEAAEAGIALGNTVSPIPYTVPSTLPRNGSAVHDGVIGIGLSDNSAAVGEMTMRTDFSTQMITGDVSNVIDSDNTRLSGSLDITGGRFDRNVDVTRNFTFNADMTGRLTAGGSTFDVDATLEGDYTGTQYQYVEGFVDGTVTIDGQVAVISEGEFVGQLR